MNGQHAVLIDVGVAVVGLDGEVGLAGAVAVYLDHVGFGNAVPVELIALYAGCFIIFVGNSGVNLNGVGGKRLGNTHIGGQNFKIDLDCGSGSFGMLLGVGRDYCDGIAEWKTFSSQRMGLSQPSHLLLSGSITRPFIRFLPGTSLAVMTLKTPGIFSASEVSTPLIFA